MSRIPYSEEHMKAIPCTIETLPAHIQDCWIISVPADALETASSLFEELLAGGRKRVVFLDRKTELTITADAAACNGRQVSITRHFLECVQRLFLQDIRPGISHVDYDFHDKHSEFGITVFIK